MADDYAAALERWRSEKDAYLARHLAGQWRSGQFAGLSYFDVAPEWRVTARLEAMPPKPFEAITSSGDVREFVLHSRAHFAYAGHQHVLELFATPDAPAGPRLFLPFTDLTSGVVTYGAGRYLDPVIEAGDQQSIVLDFNLAYHPYCAYADGFSCALPPVGNRLTVAVEAGERLGAEASE